MEDEKGSSFFLKLGTGRTLMVHGLLYPVFALSICGHWHRQWHWHRHGQGRTWSWTSIDRRPLIVWCSTMRQRDSTEKRGERVLWKWNCPREKSISEKDCTPIGWRYLVGAESVWEEGWWIVRGSFCSSIRSFSDELRVREDCLELSMYRPAE